LAHRLRIERNRQALPARATQGPVLNRTQTRHAFISQSNRMDLNSVLDSPLACRHCARFTEKIPERASTENTAMKIYRTGAAIARRTQPPRTAKRVVRPVLTVVKTEHKTSPRRSIRRAWIN